MWQTNSGVELSVALPADIEKQMKEIQEQRRKLEVKDSREKVWSSTISILTVIVAYHKMVT